MADAIHEAMAHGWSDSTFNTVKWALVSAAKAGWDSRLYASYLLGGMQKDPEHPGTLQAALQTKFAEAARAGKKLPEPEYRGAFSVDVAPAPKPVLQPNASPDENANPDSSATPLPHSSPKPRRRRPGSGAESRSITGSGSGASAGAGSRAGSGGRAGAGAGAGAGAASGAPGGGGGSG